MHHKNTRHSSANHNNPQHQKDRFPTSPAPSSEKKSVLSRLRAKFQEKPATKEEVMQLGLNAKREIYKTQIQRAKSSRPSRFGSFGGGGGGSGPSYRRTSHRVQQDSGMFGGGGNSFLDFGSGPSLDFLTGGGSQRRGKNQKSGLEELF